MLVELFPFGRAKFARELVPLLQARAHGAFTACSLRDILVSARTREHDDRAAKLANEHLDAVLVHCDPRFARLEETFKPQPAAQRARPLHRVRHAATATARVKGASTSSSPPAAAASARPCWNRRWSA